MNIRFNKKPRKDTGLFHGPDGKTIVIGKDWALQNEIDETKKATQERSCFKACRTCGCCANSRRDSSDPRSYDHNIRKTIDCRGCERFRFHDCHNGLMRDAHGEAEPFTEVQLQMLDETGGKPLI